MTETPAPIFSDISKKTVSFNDCKKYASKAYDFSGTFIGWVQGDNKVFSPNCSSVIGMQEEDGMIKATGTGVIIGKGVVIDNKRAEEKRVELTLPLLNNIIKQGRPKEVNFDNIRSNRKNIKASTQKINSFNYRVEDELKIREGLLKNKIPFSITDMKQLSTMPKDERYVLRQSKPIPAALNKAIFISSDTDTQQEITATVEKNVFGGDGRTIIIPAGSQLIGVAKGKKSGLISVQKINITWDRLIRPDGVEFNLTGMNYSADAQGRAGVPGKNDTGYMKQLFIKPLLYSALPVAMEALFPTSSKYVKRTFNAEGYNAIGKTQAPNNYNFDWQNTQELRELSPKDKMKAEIEQNFKSVIHKLIEDSAKQQIPFTVPAGTRIQVYLTKDIMLRVNESLNNSMLTIANDKDNRLQDSKFTPTIDNTVSQSTSGFGTGSTSAEINEPEDAGDDAGDEEPEGAEEEE